MKLMVSYVATCEPWFCAGWLGSSIIRPNCNIIFFLWGFFYNDIQVANNGVVVACKSACDAFNQPQYCCKDYYNTPGTCPPTPYSEDFKSACPMAWTYAFDTVNTTYTCSGASYTITFCPAGTCSWIYLPAFLPSLVPSFFECHTILAIWEERNDGMAQRKDCTKSWLCSFEPEVSLSAVVTAWDFIDPALSKIFKRRIEINTVREFLGHRSSRKKVVQEFRKSLLSVGEKKQDPTQM